MGIIIYLQDRPKPKKPNVTLVTYRTLNIFHCHVPLWKRLLDVLGVGLEYFLALAKSLALNALALNTKSLGLKHLVVYNCTSSGPTAVSCDLDIADISSSIEIAFLHSSLNKMESYFNFYPRDAMLARVFAIATCLSVRPSVCPSVTRRYCAYQSESRIVKCIPSDSPITLVSGKV